MAVYKRTYKAYKGPLTPSWSRFSVLSRYGLANLFNSRPFTAYTVLCLMPFLGWLAFIYIVNSPTAQALLNLGPNHPMISSETFLVFLATQSFMGFILAAWGGPGMITKDFANHSVQLYLSRPLSRAEYLFGKVSVLGALLSCVTWIPGLVLFFVQAQLQGHGWLWENFWIAGSIVLASLLWIAMISLISMAVAVWVKWRIAATGLMLAVFFLLPPLGFVLNAILRTKWGMLLNFGYLISLVWSHLFQMNTFSRHQGGYDLVPLWSAWAMLLAVCAFCVWLLNRKLRAREVERA
jgi:ABC-2 type transport system permease protein